MNKTTLTHSFAKGLVLFFIIALALALNLAQPPLVARADEGTVTPREARRAALAWLNVCPDFAGMAYTPAPEMLEIKNQEQKQTIAYVLELQPKGFIIVTPNLELNPIVAYSEDSVFNATETPENILLDLLRGDISERLQALEKGVISSSYRDKARSRWESYMEKVDDQGQVRTEGTSRRLLQSYAVDYGPFLTSEWGQSNDGGGNAAFNYYSPPGPDGSSSNYVCGCVATALGQILNYYEWPITGTGAYTYTWDSQTLSANFGATTYEWASILDAYHDTAAITETRQAVGTLTYHAGVAVDMDYGSGGSSAYTSDVAWASKNYFRASGEYVENTGSSFYDRLYANMINHRPAELSIRKSSGGGHAVVADGIRHNTDDDDGKTRYYHLNMGWSGSNDDWYDLPDVGDYDIVDGAVLDIIPTPNLSDPGTTTTGAAIPVSWDVADLQDASKYELQQAAISNSLGDFTDDAESGTGNWAIDGYWEQSSTYSHSPSYSFHGDLYNGSTWEYPGTFTLEKAVKIDASTTITYWYQLSSFTNYEARFQIADDGTNEKNWTTLETYTSTVDVGWTLETISTADLSAYAGKVVSMRFVIDYLGGSISYGSAGFYFDDFTINNCYSGDWTVVDNNITTESKAVPVTEGGEYCYRVRAYGCDPSVQTSCSGQWWDWSDVESITVTSDSCASAATGDWSTGGTWVGGCGPPTSNSAVIKNGHTVTVDSNAQCNDLVIESGGTLVVPTGVTLTITGDWVNDGTFTPNNGTVTFNGSSAQAIGGNNTFYNLTSANTGGGVTAGDGTLTVSNLLRVQSNTFTSASDLADVQIDSGTTLALSGDITVSGDWTNNGTFTHNSNGVTFDGTTAISGSSTNSFANLTVSGNLTAPSGNMNVAGNWSSTGTFSPNNGTVTFDGASAQTITANGSSPFYNLQIGDGSSTQTVTASSNLDVNGNLTIQTGASLAGGSNTINVAGNWSESYSGLVGGTSSVIFDGTSQTIDKVITTTVMAEDFSSADDLGCCYWGGDSSPTGWIRVTDGNSNAKFWVRGDEVAPNSPNTGEGHAYRFATDNTAEDIDSWIISDGVELESGLTYEVSYKYGTRYGNAQDLMVYSGTTQSSSGMTLIGSVAGATNTTWETTEHTFTVPSDGTYYLGFRSYDPAPSTSGTRFSIDDISLIVIKEITFYNLTVNSTGSATFSKDVMVQNNLTIATGATMDMDTNKVSVSGSTNISGTLSNNESNALSLGSTQNYNDGTNILTAQLTPYTTNPGNTTVTCECGSTISDNAFGAGCSAVSDSVERYYNVTADTSTGLGITLRLYYTNAELNGNTEGSLQIYHCEGGSWVEETGTYSRDGTNNYVEVTGVDSFSPFILSGGPPTAVTLQRFTTRPAEGVNGSVMPLALVALGAVGGLVLWARRRK